MIRNVMQHIRRLEKELDLYPLSIDVIEDPQEYYQYLCEEKYAAKHGNTVEQTQF